MSFRQVRIAVLLVLLALAGGVTALDSHRARGWRAPLAVEIRPVVGDDRPETAAYVATLTPADFSAIDAFFAREAQRYGFELATPTRITLRAPSRAAPPPHPVDGGALANMAWSLQLRWWAWRDAGRWLPQVGVVRLYPVYRSPADTRQLPHSLGLQKGLIGVAHLFAAPEFDARNQVVLAHELLHTLGASDKYDPVTNAPVFPEGYAEPDKQPLLPQTGAEIMAGRIPHSPARTLTAPSLDLTRIGALTAREIGFDAAFRRHWEDRK